ncbi:MAG: alpha/beta hydrolase [Candidatus Competibacteraceae bacterium]|nr:alpha/beta hydrolase [Candidatus Competibacteraceae bacterium]
MSAGMGRAMVLVMALGLAACTSSALINGLVPDTGHTGPVSLAYGPGTRHRLDLYQPSGSRKPAPVLVFFYGGSWLRGERADYRFAAAALAARGFVVVAPDYRLYPEVRYPDFLRDCAAAVGWALRQAPRYGGDPRRVYLIGHSAGAYNAAMVAYDARWLAAEGLSPRAIAGFIGLAGPYNFLPIQVPDVMPVFDWPATSLDTQPIRHVTAAAPPTLLIVADPDEVVDPERNSAALAEALRRAGVPVEVKRYSSLNHYTTIGALAWPLRWLAPVLDDITEFVTTDRMPRTDRATPDIALAIQPRRAGQP